MRGVRCLAAWAVLATGGSCGFPKPAELADAAPGNGSARTDVVVVPAVPDRAVDLLFVVANTPTMGATQAPFAAAFPILLKQLSADDNGLPDLHIGVVSSDMGTSGSQGSPAAPVGTGAGSCSGSGDAGRLHGASSVTGLFLSDVSAANGDRQVNFTGALADAFTAAADVGTTGCSYEQPLAAMRAALKSTNASNQGFLRPAASLGVIVVDDHDDCSALDPGLFDPSTSTLGPLTTFRCFSQGVVCAPDDPSSIGPKTGCLPRTSESHVEDPSTFSEFLLSLKPDPRRIMFGIATGPETPVAVDVADGNPVLSPSCRYVDSQSQNQFVFPSIRLDAMAKSLAGARTAETLACSADLTDPLTRLGVAARQLVGDS